MVVVQGQRSGGPCGVMRSLWLWNQVDLGFNLGFISYFQSDFGKITYLGLDVAFVKLG